MPLPFRHPLALILALCGGLFGPPAQAQDGLAGAFLAAKAAANEQDFRAADLWYGRALTLAPDNAQLQFGAMVAALSLGDLARAGQLAQGLAAAGVQDPAIDLARFAALSQAKDYTGLLQAIAQGASTGTVQTELIAGWAHIGLGQMNDGLARISKAAQSPDLVGFGLYHSAIALALAGDYDGAARAMLEPGATPQRATRRGMLFLAEVLGQLGRFPEAASLVQDFAAATQDARLAELAQRLAGSTAVPISAFQDASSGLAEAFFSIASALGEDSDPAYTLLQARTAATLRPSDTEAVLLTAATLERLNQFDLAAETYGQVPPDHPDFSMAEVGRADAVYAAGRKEESLQILRALAAVRPGDLDVQTSLGHGLRREDLHDEAIAAYSRAVDLLGDAVRAENWGLFYSRAISLEAAGDFTRAEADFRRALDLNPDQPSVLNYLGYSLVDRGLKLDEALEMIQRAVTARPDAGYIVDSLAWALFRLGRFQEALAPMERAALLEPIDPVVTDHLGDVYWANGRKREAVFQWRRALSFDPSEKDAARIRQKLELGLDAVRAAEGDPSFPPMAGAAGGL